MLLIVASGRTQEVDYWGRAHVAACSPPDSMCYRSTSAVDHWRINNHRWTQEYDIMTQV